MTDKSDETDDTDTLALYRTMQSDELLELRAALYHDRKAARLTIDRAMNAVSFTTGRIHLINRVLTERDNNA